MARLARIDREPFDVAVVGGGIIGCGVARDAARRGLRVVLLERDDFGSGTTSASTRIVHGGLRYLETADFRLVRMDLRERETLLRIAPHLVKPLQFLIPFYDSTVMHRLKLRTGLTMYDALSFGSSLPRHRMLSADEARALDAALDRPGLQGAASYYDARVDSPERLCIENVADAVAHGARVINYGEAVSAMRHAGRITGLRVRDRLDGTEAELRARVTVNATGPWFEAVARGLTSTLPGRIRTTKGIHIVCPTVTERALVLFSRVDGRLMFAIPRLGHTWIGTTDTDYEGDPAAAQASRADVEYVIESVRGLFPSLTPDDVLFTTAGVRALVMQRGRTSSVSRMHKVVDGEVAGAPGLVSVLGGKITGYRAIAEEITDVVCRRLRVDRPSSTADEPLPGAGESTNTGEAAMRHLYDVYGSRAADVLALTRTRPELGQRLSSRYPDIAAQVVFAVHSEHCVTLGDFLRRRTLLGATADQGWDAAPAAAAIMAKELGWSGQQRTRELEAYRRDIDKTLAFRTSDRDRAAHVDHHGR